MKIICKHCKHEWDYKGKGQYATCPACHYKVKTEKSVNQDREKSKLKVSQKVSNSKLEKEKEIEERIRSLEEKIREIQRSLTLKIPIQRKPKGILTECEKCGYEWYFTGLKKIARCPECNARVKIKENNLNNKQ